MTENFIIVENVDEKELEKILLDLANLYANTKFVNGIQFYKRNDNFNSFLILFSNQPDFARFNYFVNYINYPAEHERFSPFIRGYYKTTDIKEKSEFNVGDWIMVYISKNDKEYDNVTLVNYKSENYLYDFGGKIKKLKSIEEMFKSVDIDKDNYYHIRNIIPSKSVKNEANQELLTERKTKKFFAMIGCLAFTVFAIMILKDSKEVTIPTIIFFGLGFVVLLWDFIFPKKFKK